MILKLNKFSARDVTTAAYKLHNAPSKSFMFVTLESEQLLLKVSDHKMSTIEMCSLSNTRNAYARKGEEMSTLIIRDTTEGISRAFGVKGRKNLLNLYYGILALLRANRAKILQKDGRKYAYLSHFLDSLGAEDVQEMDKLNVEENDQLRVPYLRLMPFLHDNYPRIGLYLYDLADMYATSTYLFVDQLVKLLKWMNQNQDIGVTKFTSYDTSNDDFIDLMRD